MPVQKRWNASRDGTVLASLFDNGLADPTTKTASEIDVVKKMREEFTDFTEKQFRDNYKTTATNWIAGKGVEGVRLKELLVNLKESSKEKKEADKNKKEESKEDIAEEDDEYEYEEEEEEEQEQEQEQEKLLAKPVRTMSKTTAATTSVGKKKYKPNETPFHPRFTCHSYPAKNHWRVQLIIETPGSFTGAKGTYEATIDDDCMQFVFKIPPNDIFNDPQERD